MSVLEDEIRAHLSALSEDSYWELKQIEFKGNSPVSPKCDDLADELIAFANAKGGYMLCGVTDTGDIQGMSRPQLQALTELLGELSTDTIEPSLRIDVQQRMLDGKAFVLVEVPRGDTVHERSGLACIRVGSTKRRLSSDERMRLAQRRAQSRYLWFDEQTVPDTGFESLEERLWESLVSAAQAHNPRKALSNLCLIAEDESGAERVTNAGLLLCTRSPQQWLPQAVVTATRYRGTDRASGQLDAQEISGPLHEQVRDAVKFIIRNMRVGARKMPARENLPQYSQYAVFEAIVNAVAHRDYSITSQRIRISMFEDRLEIESPGSLPNRMTLESMESRQVARNGVIASVFGRIPVDDIPGSDRRLYLMERRGDGVAVIRSETEQTSGFAPEYQIIDDACLRLAIPAAKIDLIPCDSAVTVHAAGVPIAGVDVLAIFPNKTWLRSKTDEHGQARFSLYTSELPMTVYAAAPNCKAGHAQGWLPRHGGHLMEVEASPTGGSLIIAQAAGYLPDLAGRINPQLDSSGRTYLYADNIAIDGGRPQPVPFRLGKPVMLTDANGMEMTVTFVDMMGRSALLNYCQAQ